MTFVSGCDFLDASRQGHKHCQKRDLYSSRRCVRHFTFVDFAGKLLAGVSNTYQLASGAMAEANHVRVAYLVGNSVSICLVSPESSLVPLAPIQIEGESSNKWINVALGGISRGVRDVRNARFGKSP